MEYENTKCQGCGTNEGPLSWIQPMNNGEDFWCEKCKAPEMEKRAKESKAIKSKGHYGQKN